MESSEIVFRIARERKRPNWYEGLIAARREEYGEGNIPFEIGIRWVCPNGAIGSYTHVISEPKSEAEAKLNLEDFAEVVYWAELTQCTKLPKTKFLADLVPKRLREKNGNVCRS